MIRLPLTFTACVALMLVGCDQPSAPVEASAPETSAPDTPSAQAASDFIVLTAQGWGPLRIGMTRSEITEALGPDANPGAVGAAEPEYCDEYRPERAPQGMLLMLEEGVLTRISLLEGSTLTTDRGFGVGAPAAAVKAAYGEAAVASPHKYVDAPAEYVTVWADGFSQDDYREDQAVRGVVYEVGDDGRVSMIHAGGPSIQYVEGCA